MISIIVPIYDVESYLSQCIESLVKQTYQDIEIILIDDGSPDRCGDICDAWGAKDTRIKVIHQANAGVSAARNAGLRIAKGRYIGFVDPDDWVAPEMYENMVKAIDETQADLAICGYHYYDENGKLDKQRLYPLKGTEVIIQKELNRRYSDIPPSVRHVVWNKLFRHDMMRDLWFMEGIHSSEDVFFLTDYTLRISRAVVIHHPYYCNRVRSGSATHGGLSTTSLADSFRAHDYMYRQTVKADPELKNISQSFLLDVCVRKYNDAVKGLHVLRGEEKKEALKALIRMKKYIKSQALKSLLNPDIYWKTRLYYLIF